MTRATAVRALALAALIAVSGCGGSGKKSVYVRFPSLREAAATISHHCTRDLTSSDSNGLLWLRGGRRPLVYYASFEGDPPNEVLTTRGSAVRPWGVLWPCDPPVVIHYPNTHTASVSSSALLTVLASKPSERKTIRLGQVRLANPENRNSLSSYANGLVAPTGKIIFFDGTKIRYAGGPEFSVRGLSSGWQLTGLVVSPHNPSVFLATAKKGGSAGQSCGAALYRVTPTSSSKLRAYSACTTGLAVQWSPDGRQILWFVSPGGNATHLLVSDAEGRHLHELFARVNGAVWSPDSRSIAYGYYRGRDRWTSVLNLSSRARHVVGKGEPLAWSPDGKEIALINQSPVIPSSAGSIVAVPAAGGRPRLLLRVPPAPSG